MISTVMVKQIIFGPSLLMVLPMFGSTTTPINQPGSKEDRLPRALEHQGRTYGMQNYRIQDEQVIQRLIQTLELSLLGSTAATISVASGAGNLWSFHFLTLFHLVDCSTAPHSQQAHGKYFRALAISLST